MLAWQIFKKAVLLIVDNLGAALRVSVVPYGAMIIANLFLVGNQSVTNLAMGDLQSLPPGFFFNMFVSLLVQMAALLWIAVAWHRFALLADGGQAWIPTFNGGLILGYFGRMLLIILLIFAAVVAISTLLSFAPFLAVPAAGIVSVVLFYRLGLILPAGAVDKPINLGEAWRATQGQSGTVVVLALITVVASFLVQLPTAIDAVSSGAIPPDASAQDLAALGRSPVTMVYELVMNWLGLLIGVSLLSTLYGHFVEGRALD